jgi:hypothetical protein
MAWWTFPAVEMVLQQHESEISHAQSHYNPSHPLKRLQHLGALHVDDHWV